jgi:hypothetical protein
VGLAIHAISAMSRNSNAIGPAAMKENVEIIVNFPKFRKMMKMIA